MENIRQDAFGFRAAALKIDPQQAFGTPDDLRPLPLRRLRLRLPASIQVQTPHRPRPMLSNFHHYYPPAFIPSRCALPDRPLRGIDVLLAHESGDPADDERVLRRDVMRREAVPPG